jgi:hypothetical protein
MRLPSFDGKNSRCRCREVKALDSSPHVLAGFLSAALAESERVLFHARLQPPGPREQLSRFLPLHPRLNVRATSGEPVSLLLKCLGLFDEFCDLGRVWLGRRHVLSSDPKARGVYWTFSYGASSELTGLLRAGPSGLKIAQGKMVCRAASSGSVKGHSLPISQPSSLSDTGVSTPRSRARRVRQNVALASLILQIFHVGGFVLRRLVLHVVDLRL